MEKLSVCRSIYGVVFQFLCRLISYYCNFGINSFMEKNKPGLLTCPWLDNRSYKVCHSWCLIHKGIPFQILPLFKEIKFRFLRNFYNGKYQGSNLKILNGKSTINNKSPHTSQQNTEKKTNNIIVYKMPDTSFVPCMQFLHNRCSFYITDVVLAKLIIFAIKLYFILNIL